MNGEGEIMTNRTDDFDPRSLARVAGILYLTIILCGLFSEAVVRSSLIVPGDPAATAAGILGAEWLFRLGFAGDAIMILADVGLAVLLYVLLRPVSRTLALLAAATRLAQAAVLGMNLLNYYLAVLILDGGGVTGVFAVEQREALASLFLDAHAHGYDLGLLFFGLHCLVLGSLLVRSTFAPAILGRLIQVTGAVYLAGTLTRFLEPDHLAYVAPLYLIAVISELSLCIWLLTRAGRPIQAAPRHPGIHSGHASRAGGTGSAAGSLRQWG